MVGAVAAWRRSEIIPDNHQSSQVILSTELLDKIMRTLYSVIMDKKTTRSLLFTNSDRAQANKEKQINRRLESMTSIIAQKTTSKRLVSKIINSYSKEIDSSDRATYKAEYWQKRDNYMVIEATANGREYLMMIPVDYWNWKIANIEMEKAIACYA